MKCLAPICCLAVLIPLSQVAYIEYATPEPPEGWEKEVTPGLNPSVESTLLDGSANRDEEAAVYWDGWGIDALNPVIRLYEDARWKDYHVHLRRLLFLCPYDESVDYLKDRISSLAKTAESDKEDEKELFELSGWLRKYRPAVAEDVLQELLELDSATVRRVVAKTYLGAGTQEGIERARDLIPGLPEEMRAALFKDVARSEAHMRANEPMEWILKKESAEREDTR